MNNPADWVGRRVTIIDGFEERSVKRDRAFVVDDAPIARRHGVKVGNGRYKGYRSCDLCWLQDIASGGSGPVWSTKRSVRLNMKSDRVNAACPERSRRLIIGKLEEC